MLLHRPPTPRRLARRATAAVAAAALALAVGGCLPETTVGGDGMVGMLVGTSAPGRVRSGAVTITGVDFVRDSDSVGVPLLNGSVTVDLVGSATGPLPVVPSAVLPQGRYTAVRFRIGGAYVEVDNGDSTTSVYASSSDYAALPPGTQVDGTLRLPSDVPEEVAVALPGGGLTISGTVVGFLATLDLTRSFAPSADSSGWVLDPVIALTDLTNAGAATVELRQGGSVALPTVNGRQVTLDDFTARLTDRSGTVRASRFSGSGPRLARTQVGPLQAGPAELEIVPPAGVTITTTPATPLTVTIEAGGAITVSVTMSEATAGG